jgi:hypothetical protein
MHARDKQKRENKPEKQVSKNGHIVPECRVDVHVWTDVCLNVGVHAIFSTA